MEMVELHETDHLRTQTEMSQLSLILSLSLNLN